MKTILLIRHAKSSWITGHTDFDRPLNERGLKDAPEMAKRLLDKGIMIDAFITSAAVRACTTASIFHAAYKARENQLIKKEELYHAYPPAYFSIIKSLNNLLSTVAIFAHNPGITDMANLMDVAKIDNMPTCGIFAVQASIENWHDFETSEKTLCLFDFPKNS